MASWRRWIVMSAICCTVACGCGGSDTKKPDGAVEGGPPVVAAPAVAAPKRTPPAVAAPSLSGMQELLQYAPENLKLAAGASVAVIEEKTHPVGARLLTQFQPVIATLARAGVNVDQIDKLWGGVNRETGDLIVCVRTKGNYDVAAATTGLGASGTADRVGKATVYNLPAHPVYKNAVAFIDPKTFLMGRYATVTAALTNPKPGPVRLGYDALNQPDAYYWIAGDDSCVETWLKSGGIDPLELLAADAVNLRGIGVGFGGKGASPSPTGAASASGAIDLSIGMGFVSEALASSVEKKFSQMLKLRQKAAPQRSDTSGPPTPPDDDGKQYRFQPGSGNPDDDDRRNPLGRLRLNAVPSAVDQKLTDGALKVQRTKENLQVSLSVAFTGVPLINRLISDALPATGASAVSDGLLDGTLTVLADGLQQWPNARPDTLKGVRRIGELRLALGYSWMTELLPFIGHGDLYSQLDLKKSWSDPGNRPLTMTVIPAFLNPADPRSTWNGYPEYFNGMGLAHFVGMSGVEDRRNVVAAELPRSDPQAGIFGYDEVARPGDVSDGTSQTIMMIGSGAVTAPWIQGGGATIRGARAPYFHKFTGFGSRGLAAPGTYVLFADGSARAISATIDPEVFKALCTMHGAEQVDMSGLNAPEQN